MITRYEQVPIGLDAALISIRCWTCGGTGQFTRLAEDTCPTCEGSGRHLLTLEGVRVALMEVHRLRRGPVIVG